MEKFYLEYEGHFDAAHCLRGYSGLCANLHGHRWKVKIQISGDCLNEIGILVDFKDLKKMMKRALPDHCYLNDFPEFAEKNPTAENLAPTLFRIFEQELRGVEAGVPGTLTLEWVRVWESPEACAMVKRRDSDG